MASLRSVYQMSTINPYGYSLMYLSENCLPPKVQDSVIHRLCGVEIEVENACGFTDASIEQFQKFWFQTDDGSLRNRGVEFVTLIGLKVGHLPNALATLNSCVNNSREIQGSNKYYSFSERCSVHIHLDVRHFTTNMVHNLLMVYTIFEDTLFKMCHPLRKGNIFCLPLKDTNLEQKNIGGSGTILDIINNGEKYTAINVAAIKKYGSVEFRHHEGTFDVTTLMNWVYILSLLVHYAERTPISEVQARVFALKSESAYDIFARDVFYGFAPLLLRNLDPMEMDVAVSCAKLFTLEKIECAE
jgi:hypothetical protein